MYFEILDTNIRILGSMHLVPRDNSPIPDWAFSAYEWSEALVFESNPPAILEHIRESDPSGWCKHLQPKILSCLKNNWLSNGCFPEFEEVHPWAAMLFSSVFSMQVAEGVEPSFLRMASDDSKTVDFLENAKGIAQLFSKVPLKLVIESLEILASDLSVPRSNLEDMYTAWLNKDLASIYEIALRSEEFRNPSLRQIVLNERNLSWLPMLNQLLNSNQKILIAVGALHLYGPGNIIELMGRKVRCVQDHG